MLVVFSHSDKLTYSINEVRIDVLEFYVSLTQQPVHFFLLIINTLQIENSRGGYLTDTRR